MGCYNLTITSKNSGTFEVPAFIDRYIDKAFVFNELILFSQGGIYIFVPKVSCFVRNQWCPSKVSTNCMHYDDSE
jgi:hypothetical protein